MPLISPFTGLRPKKEFAKDVIAPPYDVLNTEEARIRVEGRPKSFLHISKPEIDLPIGTDPFDASVYAKGAENLNNLVSEGILFQDDAPCYYVYKLVMGSHEQYGLVAAASVADYDTNRIRKHEFTRPEKEDDRVRQIDALNTQTGPVFLTYRHNKVIDDIVADVCKTNPEYDLTADDGVQHTIWVVNDQSLIDTITSTFDSMESLYIADGHHRSASASRIAAQRNGGDSEAAHNYFLSVIFPDNQMQILDYNRVMKDLNGLTNEEFLAKVAMSFTIKESADEYKPSCAKTFGMFLSGKWYSLTINEDLYPADDPVGRLDVSLLQNHLITPILGIDDPRRDKRIDFVGGIRGLKELEKRVNSGEMAVAFAIYPTSLDALMAVADADEVMPPKSTWFEPKLADGLVSHVID